MAFNVLDGCTFRKRNEHFSALNLVKRLFFEENCTILAENRVEIYIHHINIEIHFKCWIEAAMWTYAEYGDFKACQISFHLLTKTPIQSIGTS